MFVISFLLLFTSFLVGSVAPNPFLRPGSRKPPPPSPPPQPPKPQVNPEIFKEVEFRGFFLLNGVPHFCIFNKKANLGEWIRLSEKTYEAFEAESFDLKTETLTLAYNGQKYTFSLEESKGGSSGKTSAQQSSIPKLPKPTGGNTSSRTKVMPPKPLSTPKLPDWLVQRSKQSNLGSSTNPGRPSFINSSSSNRAVLPGMIPTRNAPESGIASAVGGDVPTVRSTVPSSPSGISSSFPSTSSPTNNSFSNSSGNSSPGSELNSQAADQDGEIDLSSLPPPPPPPNILPPSGPPNIVPSRDE